jgi:hypothetical protein
VQRLRVTAMSPLAIVVCLAFSAEPALPAAASPASRAGVLPPARTAPGRAELLGGIGTAVALSGAALFGIGQSFRQNYGASQAPSLMVGGGALAGVGAVLVVLSIFTWVWEGDRGLPPTWVLW